MSPATTSAAAGAPASAPPTPPATTGDSALASEATSRDSVAVRVGRGLLDSLRIRRPEFLPAEIPILLIPVLIAAPAGDASWLRAGAFWEGVVVFFLLFHFGDMINCLFDRDLDAVYKPHLSRAVFRLGVRHVAAQIGLTAAAALGLTAHIAWSLGRWWLLPLVAVGLLVAAAYSAPPARLKGRGVGQLLCLWTVIFIGPMAFAAGLVADAPPARLLLLAAAYATVQMGIILVNTAEDLPEDRAAGVRTTVVALGLRRAIALAAGMTVIGAAGVVAVLAACAGAAPRAGFLLPAALAGAFAAAGVLRLWRAVATSRSPEAAIARVKAAGRRVPAWLGLVAWGTLVAAWGV